MELDLEFLVFVSVAKIIEQGTRHSLEQDFLTEL